MHDAPKHQPLTDQVNPLDKVTEIAVICIASVTAAGIGTIWPDHATTFGIVRIAALGFVGGAFAHTLIQVFRNKL